MIKNHQSQIYIEIYFYHIKHKECSTKTSQSASKNSSHNNNQHLTFPQTSKSNKTMMLLQHLWPSFKSLLVKINSFWPASDKTLRSIKLIYIQFSSWIQPVLMNFKFLAQGNKSRSRISSCQGSNLQPTNYKSTMLTTWPFCSNWISSRNSSYTDHTFCINNVPGDKLC